jgi:hypothetical protein
MPVLVFTKIKFLLVKAKYGSDYDPNTSDSGLSTTDSESAESEDENGDELTPMVDVAILRTLARIKEKDPDIYDSSKNIFGGAFNFVPCQDPHVDLYFRGTRKNCLKVSINEGIAEIKRQSESGRLSHIVTHP